MASRRRRCSPQDRLAVPVVFSSRERTGLDRSGGARDRCRHGPETLPASSPSPAARPLRSTRTGHRVRGLGDEPVEAGGRAVPREQDRPLQRVGFRGRAARRASLPNVPRRRVGLVAPPEPDGLQVRVAGPRSRGTGPSSTVRRWLRSFAAMSLLTPTLPLFPACRPRGVARRLPGTSSWEIPLRSM